MSRIDRKDHLADDELLNALLEAAQEVTMRRGAEEVPSYLPTLLVLAAHTGRRRAALCGLRWSDWKPELATYGALTWRGSLDKLGRTTRTPVTPEVRAAIEEHRRRYPGVGDAQMFPAPESEGSIRGDVAHRWLIRAFEVAAIERSPGFGFHAFRRMFATRLKHRAPQDVAGLGGWKDLKTLQRVYQRADLESMEEAVLDARPLRLRAALGP